MGPMPFSGVQDVVRRRMSQIRKTDTKPELVIRRVVHSLGFRYRLHRRDLPGTPDLTFGSRRKVIFVHGCFWHQHDCTLGRKQPQSRREYWGPKLLRNVQRDVVARQRLADTGWDVFVVWECETRDAEELSPRLYQFLTAAAPATACRAAAARHDQS